MAQTRIRTFNLINSNDRSYDLQSIYSNKTSSLNDSFGTIPSCSDDSLLSDNQEIRRNHHYKKHSKLNRYDDHITSLKRRVRKQQLRHEQNEVTNFQFPSSTDLFVLPFLQQPVTPCHYRTKKSGYVVPLPPLITNSRVVQTRAHGIKLNMYG